MPITPASSSPSFVASPSTGASAPQAAANTNTGSVPSAKNDHDADDGVSVNISRTASQLYAASKTK